MNRYANNFVHDSFVAEDLVQDVYAHIASDNVVYNEQGNLKGWLLRSLKNRCINELNRRARRGYFVAPRDDDDHDQIFNLSYCPSDNADSHLNTKGIWEHLNLLSDKQREIFLLWYDDYKYVEIAEMLHLPLGTVKSRINSARAILQSALIASGYRDDRRAA